MMGQCKQCGHQAGLLGLTKGLCKSCKTARQDHSSDILEGRKVGAKIARNCYHNELSQGERLLLSEISTIVNQGHTYNRDAAEAGFFCKMKSYRDRGVVVTLMRQDGDIIFVHKNYTNKI
jgi:hypothetical protein